MEVIDAVRHYQRSIEKCAGNEERMLHCLGKLYNLPVTVQHLQDTGVGRTVNALRKYEGDTGEAAKALVIKWKEMVAAEDASDDEEVNGNVNDTGETEPEPEVHKVSSHKHKSSKSNHRKEELHHSDKYKSTHKNHVSSSHKSKDKSNYKILQHKEQSHKRRGTDEHMKKDSKRKKKLTEEVECRRESSSDDTSGNQQEEESEHEHSNAGDSSSGDGIHERLEGEEEDEGGEESSEEEMEVKKKLHKSREERSDSHDSYRNHRKNKERELKSEGSRRNENKSRESHRTEEKTSSSKDEKGKGKDKSKERHRQAERKKEELEKQHKEHRYEKEKLKTKPDAAKHESKTASSSRKENTIRHEAKPKDSCVPKKLKVAGASEDGIDSFSGTSFADALGMVEVVEKKKKKKPTETGGYGSSKKESGRQSETTTAISTGSRSEGSSSHEMGSSTHRQSSLENTCSSDLNLLAPTTKLEPLRLEVDTEVDVDATLPIITPHYRPLPHANIDAMGASRSRSRPLSEEEALSQVMSTKNQRTKVYSGVKSSKSWSRVPSLYDICIRILQENIEALEYTGGVPYDLLKPVLAHATPEQLIALEEYNPYLVEDTDELWESHCRKKFRNNCRLEMESYREMYMRCCEEREAKLKELTANIHNSMAKLTPVRQTKLAYVDSIAKPPRQVARKQAKYGTAQATASSPMAKVQKLASPSSGMSGGSGSGSAVYVPPARQYTSTVAKGKPRMAPLMQKTMKLAKSFKR